MSMQKKAEKIVKNFFFEKMPEPLQRLRSCAVYDLHFGPMGAQYYADSADTPDWKGYSSALEALEAWAQENIKPVWVDMNIEEVLENPPEEESFDIFEFDRSAVMRAVFWKLVTDGGMSV